MDDYLFNKFIFDGIHTKKAKDLMKTLDKKGFVNKIDDSFKMSRDDINAILEYGGTTFSEYGLLLRFIKNQPINYKEKFIQEMILKHKSLSEFALLDSKCPKELKEKIPSHITPQKPPLSIREAIQQTGKPLLMNEVCEKIKETTQKPPTPKIKDDTEFIKEKERCLKLIESDFGDLETNQYMLEQNIKDCLKVCRYTDDVSYKKALYTSINKFYLSNNIATMVANNINKEYNTEVLSHILDKCPMILRQQTGFMNDTAIIFDIAYNPAITKNMIAKLSQHFNAEDYCQNKCNLCIAELLLENDVFPIEAYEYYAKNRHFGQSYRENNANIIQNKILYSNNTPVEILKLMTENSKQIAIPAEIRIETGLCGEQLENIYDAIFHKNLNAFYNLDDNLKTKMITAISNCYPSTDILTSLCLDNDNFSVSDMKYGLMHTTTQILQNNYCDYDGNDPLVGYCIIQEYKNSMCFKYVMAEREYLAEKEKINENKNIADEVLSSDCVPTNISLYIEKETDEIEL